LPACASVAWADGDPDGEQQGGEFRQRFAAAHADRPNGRPPAPVKMPEQLHQPDRAEIERIAGEVVDSPPVTACMCIAMMEKKTRDPNGPSRSNEAGAESVIVLDG